MGPITVKVGIDLPRDEIFRQLNDLALRPSFTEPYQTEFRLQRVNSTGVGAAARFRTDAGGWAGTEIVRVEPPYRLVERGQCGRNNRVPTTTVWELIESSGGICEVTVTYFTRPERLMDRLAERWRRAESRHKRGWRESLDRLRERLESGTTAELAGVRIAGGDRRPVSPSGTLASI